MSTFEFRLPDVGEGIAEAELIDWRVAVGDVVTVDQVIAVIETDKSQIEMPVPVAGTVLALNAQPGEVIKVGGLLITVDAVAAASGKADMHHPAAPAAATRVASAAPPVAPLGKVLASPSTRKLASDLGVDLAAVRGSGPAGRIVADDVHAAAQGGATTTQTAPSSAAPSGGDTFATGPVRVVKLQGVRRAIASSMTAALQIPHITEFREIDATELLAARNRLSAAMGDTRVSVTPLLLRACVLALHDHPTMNARFDVTTGTINEYEHIHLGIATATDDGLIVPVLHDAQSITLTELPTHIDELVASAKARTASSAQLQGGTFTVTNFGSFGTWLGTPVIRPPEVAIAGFGRIADKVVAADGLPVVRPVLPIVVAADHRINDGAHLGAFVTTLASLLTAPDRLGI